MTTEGKLFQTRAAATQKERLPMVEWRATATLKLQSRVKMVNFDAHKKENKLVTGTVATSLRLWRNLC